MSLLTSSALFLILFLVQRNMYLANLSKWRDGYHNRKNRHPHFGVLTLVILTIGLGASVVLCVVAVVLEILTRLNIQ